MEKRVKLSKKIRFEVFKRDGFKCQYCGATSPEVVLEVDHIVPVVDGGKNDMVNLVTSCFDCNRGKNKTRLEDKSMAKIERSEIDKIKIIKEQFDMYVEWKKELLSIESKMVEYLNEKFHNLTNNKWNEPGIVNLLKLIKKHGYKEVDDAIDMCFQKGLSPSDYLQFIPKAIYYKKESIKNPLLKDFYYIRKILINRFCTNTFQERKASAILSNLFKGVNESDIERIKHNAKNADSLYDFEIICTN